MVLSPSDLALLSDWDGLYWDDRCAKTNTGKCCVAAGIGRFVCTSLLTSCALIGFIWWKRYKNLITIDKLNSLNCSPKSASGLNGTSDEQLKRNHCCWLGMKIKQKSSDTIYVMIKWKATHRCCWLRWRQTPHRCIRCCCCRYCCCWISVAKNGLR